MVKDSCMILKNQNLMPQNRQRNNGKQNPETISFCHLSKKLCKGSSTGCKNSETSEDMCPSHGTNYKLNFFLSFRALPLTERLDLIKQKVSCFRNITLTNVGKPSYATFFSSVKHPLTLHVDLNRRENTRGKSLRNKPCAKINSSH